MVLKMARGPAAGGNIVVAEDDTARQHCDGVMACHCGQHRGRHHGGAA